MHEDRAPICEVCASLIEQLQQEIERLRDTVDLWEGNAVKAERHVAQLRAVLKSYGCLGLRSRGYACTDDMEDRRLCGSCMVLRDTGTPVLTLTQEPTE